MSERKGHVEVIRLAPEMEKEVALATVRIGDVLIRRVRVWRSTEGKLCVFFPSYRLGRTWEDLVDLPKEVRSEVEADVIAAYKAAKEKAKSTQKAQARSTR